MRVNSAWNPQIAPRGGDWLFLGGIHRDVYLVVTNPLHVTWYGTSVTTPQATAAQATVKVKTEIKNDGAAAGELHGHNIHRRRNECDGNVHGKHPVNKRGGGV